MIEAPLHHQSSQTWETYAETPPATNPANSSFFAYPRLSATMIVASRAWFNQTLSNVDHYIDLFSAHETLPLTSRTAILVVVLTYVALVNIARRNRLFPSQRIWVVWSLRAHYLLFTCLSALLASLLLREIVQLLLSSSQPFSITNLVCDPNKLIIKSARVRFVFYLNYLSKIAELWYGVLLALRPSGPGPLAMHQYHQICLLLLCYIQLGQGGSSAQWVAIFSTNALHVVMFYYLFLVSRDQSVRWKALIPSLQTIQSIIMTLLFSSTLFSRVLYDLSLQLQSTSFSWIIPYLGSPPRCSGSWTNANLSLLLIITYPFFYLFLHRPSPDVETERGMGLFLALSRPRYAELNNVPYKAKSR